MPALTWLGECSYSLYLLHWPLLSIVAQRLSPNLPFALYYLLLLLLGLPVCLLAAWLSSLAFERPFLRRLPHPAGKTGGSGDAVTASTPCMTLDIRH